MTVSESVMSSRNRYLCKSLPGISQNFCLWVRLYQWGITETGVASKSHNKGSIYGQWGPEDDP